MKAYRSRPCRNCNTVIFPKNVGHVYCSKCKRVAHKKQITEWQNNNKDKINKYRRKKRKLNNGGKLKC